MSRISLIISDLQSDVRIFQKVIDGEGVNAVFYDKLRDDLFRAIDLLERIEQDNKCKQDDLIINVDFVGMSRKNI